MRFLGLIIGALVGLVSFYMAGAFVMCTFVWPTSNLCGLPSVFFMARIGLVLGAVIGWRSAANRTS